MESALELGVEDVEQAVGETPELHIVTSVKSNTTEARTAEMGRRTKKRQVTRATGMMDCLTVKAEAPVSFLFPWVPMVEPMRCW